MRMSRKVLCSAKTAMPFLESLKNEIYSFWEIDAKYVELQDE